MGRARVWKNNFFASLLDILSLEFSSLDSSRFKILVTRNFSKNCSTNVLFIEKIYLVPSRTFVPNVLFEKFIFSVSILKPTIYNEQYRYDYEYCNNTFYVGHLSCHLNASFVFRQFHQTNIKEKTFTFKYLILFLVSVAVGLCFL